jgi:hypothetical protein
MKYPLGLLLRFLLNMDKISTLYKDTKPLMSSLLLFNRIYVPEAYFMYFMAHPLSLVMDYRLEIQSVMLVFSTPLVN